MKVLVDTNILIDQVCCRELFVEDANQYYSAQNSKIDCIVTRDKKGFEDSVIPCYNIKDFLKLF